MVDDVVVSQLNHCKTRPFFAVIAGLQNDFYRKPALSGRRLFFRAMTIRTVAGSL